MGGGLGWDITLEYYETEKNAKEWQIQRVSPSGDRCTFTLKRLEPHFYLNGIFC
jgi:hypothetical protein